MPSKHSNEAKDASKIFVALALTVAVLAFELFGAFLSNSLALFADAAHVFSDAFSLALAFFALKLAQRKASENNTFGYHRAEVFAAVLNGFLLLAISVFILLQAMTRFLNPPEVKAVELFAFSSLGLLANLWVVSRLHGHKNVNVQAAFWHAAGDAVSSVGVVLASVLIYFTGMVVFDALVSLLVVVVLVFGAVRVLYTSLHILLEFAPPGLTSTLVGRTICSVKDVVAVHDVRVWACARK